MTTWLLCAPVVEAGSLNEPRFGRRPRSMQSGAADLASVCGRPYALGFITRAVVGLSACVAAFPCAVGRPRRASPCGRRCPRSSKGSLRALDSVGNTATTIAASIGVGQLLGGPPLGGEELRLPALSRPRAGSSSSPPAVHGANHLVNRPKQSHRLRLSSSLPTSRLLTRCSAARPIMWRCSSHLVDRWSWRRAKYRHEHGCLSAQSILVSRESFAHLIRRRLRFA